MVSNAPQQTPTELSNPYGSSTRDWLTEKMRDNITGWLFIAPAMILTFVFGIFPIVYAGYMSFHGRRADVDICSASGEFVFADCLSNYTQTVGDWLGALVFLIGLLIIIGSYWFWAGEKHYFAKPIWQLGAKNFLVRALLPIMLIVAGYFFLTISQDTFARANDPLSQEQLVSADTLETVNTRFSDEARAVWDASDAKSEILKDVLRRCDRNFDTSDEIAACADENPAIPAWAASNQSQPAFNALDFCRGTYDTRDAILDCLNDKVDNLRQIGTLQIILVPLAVILAFYIFFAADRTGLSKHEREQTLVDFILRLIPTLLVMGIGFFLAAVGYTQMITSPDVKPEFLDGMIVTFYYAMASVPVQLTIGIVLAYVLYQKLRGKQFFRMIFFMPYVTPAVASAVVFRLIFRPGESLANNIVGAFGVEPQRWVHEPEPFMNTFFGLDLQGFFAGPSMALISVVLLGIWTYVGYNTVIFLAGMGQIPGDLYEAAEVDGANDWHLFRHITLPLLSPITFYLSVLAFIGTFKAFNHIYVMRDPAAQGTIDTASIIVYQTFKEQQEYGFATAQAILLFLIILGLTQVQRTFFEKKVFYG